MADKMETIKELKNICQYNKRKNKNFLLNKGYLFHRNISIYITKFFLIFFPKINPNLISFFMIVVSLFGSLMLLSSNFIVSLLGILLVYFGFLLDKVDGEIARYKNIFSLSGVYLDELYHIIVPNILLICFLFPITINSFQLNLILLLLILFNLLNRYNRKIYLIIFVKLNKLIKEKKVVIKNSNNLFNKFFRSIFFKIFGIVERFDFIILSIFLLILFEHFFIIIIKDYYLIFYFLFSFIYFIRWIIINYFGNIDSSVKRLINNNY